MKNSKKQTNQNKKAKKNLVQPHLIIVKEKNLKPLEEKKKQILIESFSDDLSLDFLKELKVKN